MYDFAIGDVLSMKSAAYDMDKVDINNPDDSAIKYHVGTQVTVVKIEPGSIYLEFPDGAIVPNDPMVVLYHFNRVIENKLIRTKLSTGFGTPPPGLIPFIPEEADWRNNYRYTVYVELEDRGPKAHVCPKCYSDLGKRAKRNEQGLLKCVQCDMFVIPMQTKAEDEINGHGPLHGGSTMGA